MPCSRKRNQLDIAAELPDVLTKYRKAVQLLRETMTSTETAQARKTALRPKMKIFEGRLVELEQQASELQLQVPAPTGKDYRALMTEFCSQPAPHKLRKVEDLLVYYAGREEEMMADLKAKYTATPSSGYGDLLSSYKSPSKGESEEGSLLAAAKAKQ